MNPLGAGHQYLELRNVTVHITFAPGATDWPCVH
jgi:hypothetical protein